MRRSILFWALLLLVPSLAWAADTNKYPHTLIDQTCTDSYDVPAGATPPPVKIGGFISPPAVQISGSPDNLCDNNSYIMTGAKTADVSFGPFMRGKMKGFVIAVDADTVVGGTPTWAIKIRITKPHDAADATYDQVSDSGAGNKVFVFGTNVGTPSGADDQSEIPIPDTFKIQLDLVAATSITAEISLVPY